MTEPASAALLEALALLRAPRGPRPGREQRLPQGILQLLRVAAGEEEALSNAQESTRESQSTLREAAAFYIQQVLFAADSNSFRVLGVDPNESDERIREHYRWLARWLHPDRNPDPWEVVFADRVSQAWQDLRTSDRRARYQAVLLQQDEAWSAIPSAAPPLTPGRVYRAPMEEPAAPSLARRDLRWVPSAVLASLGIVAIGLVVLFYAIPVQRPVALAGVESAELDEAERRGIVADAAVARGAIQGAETLRAVEHAPEPAPAVEAASLELELPVADAVVAEVPVADRPAKPAAAEAQPPVPAPVAAAPAPAPREPIATPKPERVAKVVAREPAPARRPAAAERALAQRAAASSAAPAAPPAVSSSAEPRPESAVAKLGARDADRLLSTLSRAYERGSVPEMRTLFAADAQGPRGGLKSILSDYNRVFADSSTRSLAMRDVSWFESGETFTIVASFEATLTSRRTGRERRTRGDIRLDLRREGDAWQIYRIRHEERPG